MTWVSAVASFLGMWMAMMTPMMLPSLVPMLWRYRRSAASSGATRLGPLTMLVGLGYAFVWALCGMVAFALGEVLTVLEMQVPALAQAVPIAGGAIVLMVGALQFSAWKAHHLACCRGTSGCGPHSADAGAAWRHGLRLGLHCCCCCAGLTTIILCLGLMDLRAMLAATAAMTIERVAPAGRRTAQGIGVIAGVAGLFLLVRALGRG
jgi:predicted metal-binding membrane protein